MAEEYERYSTANPQGWYRQGGAKPRMVDVDMIKDPRSLQSDNLIHESFPSMSVAQPAHAGSQSLSPTKELPIGQGDYEERMPLQFMPGSVSSKMSKM